MKILILGNGWLGKMMAQDYVADIYHGRIEHITVHDMRGYDVVINAAAKTDIDWCERNRYAALFNNALSARHVAETAVLAGVRHVFISSACIFESDDVKDVKYEDSKPNPKCFYAVTKWVGEELVREVNPGSMIVRIRLPISSKPSPRNTINKVITYKELVDTQESVTVIEDFIPALMALMEDWNFGTYHLINEDTISIPEIVGRFALPFKTISKETLRERMTDDGRAARVSTIVGSKNAPLLPSIQLTIDKIVEAYKMNL